MARRAVRGAQKPLKLAVGTEGWSAPTVAGAPVPPNRGMAGRGSYRIGLARAGQLCPSKRLVTEPSLKTSLIALASSGAMDSTVSLSNRFSCATGKVLV